MGKESGECIFYPEETTFFDRLDEESRKRLMKELEKTEESEPTESNSFLGIEII